MKTFFTCILAYAFAIPCYSQGWIGNGNSLFPLNAAQALQPLNIGIGTNAPSAQLHTTGTVRLAGIPNNNNYNRILAADANGNIGWRTAASLGTGTGAGWSLTGNAGTIAGTNFIGTTDNSQLVFKVNNLEIMRLQYGPAASIGIQNTFGATNWCSFAAGNGNAINGSKSMCLGWNNTSSNHNQYIIGAANEATQEYSGCFGIDLKADANRAFLIGSGIGGGTRLVNSIPNSLMIGFQNTAPTLFVKNNFVGIRTSAPTANLHSIGTVRFESLPAGTGNMLLVDATGNVFRGPVPSTRSSETLHAEIEQLKNELNTLKSLLNHSDIQGSVLYQNEPNPVSGETIIRYKIQQGSSRAFCSLMDMNGRQINLFELDVNQEELRIQTESMHEGVYIYSLLVDGILVSSRNLLVN